VQPTLRLLLAHLVHARHPHHPAHLSPGRGRHARVAREPDEADAGAPANGHPRAQAGLGPGPACGVRQRPGSGCQGAGGPAQPSRPGFSPWVEGEEDDRERAWRVERRSGGTPTLISCPIHSLTLSLSSGRPLHGDPPRRRARHTPARHPDRLRLTALPGGRAARRRRPDLSLGLRVPVTGLAICLQGRPRARPGPRPGPHRCLLRRPPAGRACGGPRRPYPGQCPGRAGAGLRGRGGHRVRVGGSRPGRCLGRLRGGAGRRDHRARDTQ